jgi:hypothetical protein
VSGSCGCCCAPVEFVLGRSKGNERENVVRISRRQDLH